MNLIKKKLLVSLSVLSTPFIVESFIDNTAQANGQYTLNNDTKTYKTAVKAASGKEAASTYTKGTYYVYKQANGMINISKTPGKAGAWINPTTNKVVASTTTSAKTESKQKKTAPTTAAPKVSTGTYTLNNDVNVYSDAVLAKSQKGSKSKYKSGNYFIFKENNGMINISKLAGKAGGWINPSENRAIIAKNSPATSKQTEVNPVVNTTNPQITIKTSNVEPGSTYILNSKAKIYSNAVDASTRKNSKKDYNQGTYYVYKIHNGMLNISRVRGKAGAWINPSESIGVNVPSTTTSTVNKTVNPTKKQNVGDLRKYSDKRFAWSWSAPSKEGLKLLEANGGKYKYYTNAKEIHLTFDSGYEAGYTAKILDTLKNNNVKAVFFVTGTYIKNNVALIKRMEAEGHIVANHTMNHYDASKTSAKVIADDIKGWETAYIKYMKKKPTTDLYRPATGTFSERTIKGAASHGYKLIQWSYAYRDWEENRQPAVATSREKLIKNSTPGGIVLLHSTSKTNRDLLDGYIKRMKSNGYTFKLVK